MNFFNNLKVGTKIFSGFVVILTLMGIVGGLAMFQFTQIKITVTNLADNFDLGKLKHSQPSNYSH